MNGETSPALGIAFDGTTATAVWRARADRAWHVERVPCDATPRAVIHACADIARAVPGAERVRVTLMRPLANARAIDFPRMSRVLLERVLERDWARHVIGMWSTPHTVAARQSTTGQWRAAFAPTETLEAIAHAAREHGWRDIVVQTSDDALAAAAKTGTSVDGSAAQFVIVADEAGCTDAVYVRAGEPFAGRRFQHSANEADVVSFMNSSIGEPARGAAVALLGVPGSCGAMAKSLGQNGLRARIIDMDFPPGASASAIIAAVGTTVVTLLELRSPAARAAQARRLRDLTGWLAGATAAALILAFVIVRVAVSSEMATVRRQRADMSGQVRNAMTERINAERTADVASVLAEREAAASRAAVTIAAVASALPAGTALTTLSVTGDSVTIEGESTRNAAVYDALRALPQLQQVRLAAPLRQERLAGDAAIERFAFTARAHGTTVQGSATR